MKQETKKKKMVNWICECACEYGNSKFTCELTSQYDELTPFICPFMTNAIANWKKKGSEN